MTGTSLTPSPLVEQALQSLRANTPGGNPAPGSPASQPAPGAAPDAQSETAPAPLEPATSKPEPGPAPETAPAEAKSAQVTRGATSRAKLLKPRGGASASLETALEALRTISASAQTRLADSGAFPELPSDRSLSDLGPYVEHVMREAQAAAAAYREEAARETTARAAKLLGMAAKSGEKLCLDADAYSEKIRGEADGYSERTLAQADALLAERVNRIAELTASVSKMAQRAGDEFHGDKLIRDQMMQLISRLTAAAEEAATEVFPNAMSSSGTQQADHPHRPAKT